MALFIKRLERPETIISRLQSSQLHAGYVVLGPGKEVGEHSTDDEEELIVVVEGKGEVISEGAAAEALEAPCAVLVPAHAMHNVRNTSEGPLKYLYVLPRE